MRKLASIRRISNISPIPDADAIECVEVDGWKVVTKKGEFQPGDLCVYFEIDSVLPIREEFEFLRKSSYVKKDWLITQYNPEGEGFRLKTIKLRGQISQGLVIPVPIGDVIYVDRESGDDRETCFPVFEGHDWTDFYDVVKWDPPLPANLSGKAKGNFPSYIPKTDQERRQNIKDQDLEPYLEDDFEVTIKLDGSSGTFFHNNGYLGVCSRNLELDWENDPNTTFARLFRSLKLDEILPTLGNIAIQGEVTGPGVQGNRENFKEHRLYVFDIYDIDTGRYLNADERMLMISDIMEQFLSRGGKESDLIRHCPVLDPIKAAKMSCQEILELAEGPSVNHSIREGLVFKSIQHPEFSFKAISNKYLLKSGN